MAKKKTSKRIEAASHRKQAIAKRKDRSNFWRSVGSIFLIFAGIVLVFGSFVHAPIPHDFWRGAWWALGIATIAAPFALIYLGLLKFIFVVCFFSLAKMVCLFGLFVFCFVW